MPNPQELYRLLLERNRRLRAELLGELGEKGFDGILAELRRPGDLLTDLDSGRLTKGSVCNPFEYPYWGELNKRYTPYRYFYRAIRVIADRLTAPDEKPCLLLFGSKHHHKARREYLEAVRDFGYKSQMYPSSNGYSEVDWRNPMVEHLLSCLPTHILVTGTPGHEYLGFDQCLVELGKRGSNIVYFNTLQNLKRELTEDSDFAVFAMLKIVRRYGYVVLTDADRNHL